MADQVYDGFISYSHAADGLLAPRLQAGLQRFAKPWWKRRAVRIFRDESSLSANPHLWSSITEALETSGWFVLLLSPDAASSVWVNEEIAYWKTHRDPSRILPVVTNGEFGWADGDVTGDAVPEELMGVFGEEPRWVDLRFARDEEQLDLKNPRFSAAVADIASALRGVPKDELESEEVRQHRRTLRTAWAAGGLVLALGVVATLAAVQATQSAREAERLAEAEAVARSAESVARAEAEANAESEVAARADADEARREAESAARLARSRELAAFALEALDEDPELSTLLALESLRTFGEGPPGFLIDTVWRAAEANHLHRVLRPGSARFATVDLSPDGTRLAAIDRGGAVTMYTAPGGETVWSLQLGTTDPLTHLAFHPDASRLVVSVADNSSHTFAISAENDQQPNRILVLDATDGSEIARIEYPACTAAWSLGWTPDGRAMTVSSGHDPCPREGASENWLELLDAETWEPTVLHDIPSEWGVGPLVLGFAESGEMYSFSTMPDLVRVLQPPDYRTMTVVPGVQGSGDVSPDGRRLVTLSNQRVPYLALFDRESGAQVDALQIEGGLAFLDAVEFSADGSRVAVATSGRHTTVFDVATGAAVLQLPGGQAASPRFSPDGRWLYTGHIDGAVRIWDTGAQTLGQTVVEQLRSTDHVNPGFSIGPDFGVANLIDVAESTTRIVLFGLEDGKLIGEIDNAFGPKVMTDGRIALNRGGLVVVHDTASGADVELGGCVSEDDETCDDTGEPVGPYLEPEVSLDQTEVMVWSPDSQTGEWWIASPDDGSVIESPAFLLEGRGPVWFTEEWILIGRGETTAMIDRATGETRASFPTPSTAFASVSRDQKVLAGAFQGYIDVLDLETLELRSFQAEFDQSRGVTLSPAGTLLAIGDANKILIFDIDAGKPVRSIPVGGASGFHWLDEETLLLGTLFPARWITVSLASESLVADAVAGLTRSFTTAECEEFAIDPCPTLEDLRSE